MEKDWLGAGSATHCLAGASMGSVTPCTVLTHCSVSPIAVTIPPKWNLLFYSFGKYLTEQVMFLSCQNIFFLILTEGITCYWPSPTPLTFVEVMEWQREPLRGGEGGGAVLTTPPSHYLGRWDVCYFIPSVSIRNLGKICSGKIRTSFLEIK